MRFVILITGSLDFNANMRDVAITSNAAITITREFIVTTFDLICVSGTNDLIFQVPKVSRDVQIQLNSVVVQPSNTLWYELGKRLELKFLSGGETLIREATTWSSKGGSLHLPYNARIPCVYGTMSKSLWLSRSTKPSPHCCNSISDTNGKSRSNHQM